MKTICKRLLSLLLVFVLVLGLMPSVYAATDDGTSPTTETATAETTAPPETVADETTPITENTEATEATEPSEATEPPETTDVTQPPTESDEESEETQSSEAAKPDNVPLMMAANNDGIMLAASTQNSIMLFDFADNGNYTSSLNSQITVKYKWNGTGSSLYCYLKNFGWHFARYGNVPYADEPLYCIEPHRDFAASTSGNSVDRDVTLDGSSSTKGGSVWYSLNANRRKAIGLILLYTDELWDHSISVTTTSKANNPNVPLRMAAQFLIFEIVCGLRDADTFVLNSTNESGTAGDIFYNAGTAAISYFAPNYNNLVSLVQSALEIPSFTSSSSGSAPVIQMNSEEISVYDSNGVLSDFSFTDKGGVEFYKSGNTLYITQTGTINESTVHTATKYIPSPEETTYNIWYMSGSTYQTTISLYSPEYGNLNAYFKVKGPAVGNLSLTKSTEDGLNLSGWRFGIYSNSACTSLVSGPHTTGSTGKINISGLAAGTYYVKELGHTDSAINSKYVCSSTNPQKVTISAGSTASVSFVNNLNQGNLALTKTTSDNQNLSGWQFSIYSDSACSTLVSGPHTTDANGKISVTGLTPGTYYVKEIGHSNATINSKYVCSSTNPQKVTITLGGTASVSFVNKLNQGNLALTKVTDDNKNLSGWQFSIYSDAACSKLVSGPHTTDANGKISVTGITPGTYYVKEIGHSNSSINSQYVCSSTNPQQVTITLGGTATVSFTNKIRTGNFSLTKTTDSGTDLAGWKFGIYSDASCTTLVSGPHTTDSSGKISVTGLKIGTYYVKELGHTDSAIEAMYSCNSENPQKVTITYGGTASVSFQNSREPGSVKIVKKTNTGTNLDGWQIGIYTDSACTKPISGSPFTTGSDGTITINDLMPQTLYAKEIPVDDPYWIVDSSVQTIKVTSNATATVTFTNNHYGDLRIKKNAINGSAEDWSFQILNTNKELVETITTGADGYATSRKLLPGKYYVVEVHDRDENYWTYDANVEQQVTVTAGKQAAVTYTNECFGRMEFQKTTNTGNQLEGWTFRVKDEDGNHIGDFTTDKNGYATTGKLKPGRYLVVEVNNGDDYWNCELGYHDVVVIAGETAVDKWHNREQGLGWFHKSTNTGQSLEGWIITIYSDKECTKEVTTVTTHEDGKVGMYLDPGVYYAKETGDTEGRFENEYWLVDESVQEFAIKPHEDVEVFFVNTQYGKLKIVKTMPSGGPLAGWEFIIRDEDGNEIEDSPFVTDDTGLIVSENILPGEYTVEEKIPEGSPYLCISENPQTITVTQGEAAEVSFTNVLSEGKISIKKVDTAGEPLAGAEFLLEWSKDGTNWMPVVRTDSEYPREGTCSSSGISDGKLTSGEDGMVTFEGLYPVSQYRLTETKAPEGFQLLKDTAFEGSIPIGEEMIVELTVVNVRIFEMPETGSKSLILMPISLALACGLCAAFLFLNKRNRK